MSKLLDVIVIGGGIAGLGAAYELKKAGAKVIVLEARDRVGGRTHSTKIDDHWFDIGGQWIGGTHDHMRELLKDLKIELFPQFDEGKHVLEIEGTTRNYSGNISTLNMAGLGDLEKAIAKLDEMALTVDPLHAANNPTTRAWDSISVDQWTNENIQSKEAKAIVNWFVRVCLAAEPAELSFLQLLHFLKTAGGYSRLADIKGGAQQDRIIGGSQLVSIRLAERLGDRVIFNSPVSKVSQHKSHVDVVVGRQVYKARYLINTVAPTLAARISYSPPLPPQRDEATQRMFMGSVIKTIVIYDAPYWRNKGFSGEAISDQGPISICYDDTSHDDKAFAIVGFIAGQLARDMSKWKAEDRKEAVLKCYARWWGAELLKPKHFLEKYWKDEEFSRGCYMGVFPPGGFTSAQNSLVAPIDRMHFAGTETASVWYGYMEGALESGKRAAREVKDRLASSTKPHIAKL